MKVLLAGGNNRLQRAFAETLLTGGHQVRVVATNAVQQAAGGHRQDIEWWLTDGDRPAPISEAGAGCDAAIIVPQSLTGDTGAAPAGAADPVTLALEAAVRGNVGRLILVSPRAGSPASAHGPGRGADAGSAVVPASFAGEWLQIRTAPVYGVTDDFLTLFLIMMRSLPAVPVLSATHRMQPLWHQDLADAVAASLSFAASEMNRVVDIAGPETITYDELFERLATVIDRRPLRVPVPDFIASHGLRLTEALRLPTPFEINRLTFATEGVIELDDRDNALSHVFHVAGTPLDQGLRRLVNDLAELTPSEGVGTLEVKRFWAEIRGSRYDAKALIDQFRSHFKDVMPIEVGVEPVTPAVELIEGGVVTMTLPGRGHVQVRVEEVGEHHVVVATLRGHALAGVVRFSTATVPESGSTVNAVKFEVTTCDTAGNYFDWLTLSLGGSRVQDANWGRVVQNVVKLSGGSADEVKSSERKLSDEESADAQRWIRNIIDRQQSPPNTAQPPPQG